MTLKPTVVRRIPRVGRAAVELHSWLKDQGRAEESWIDASAFVARRPHTNLRNAIEELVNARVIEIEPADNSSTRVRLASGYRYSIYIKDDRE